MKKTIALMTLVFSLSALAQDAAQERVELNAEKISVEGSSAILVRTNKTPGTVEVSFQVPMANSICVRQDTRLVLKPDGFHCGYEVHERRVRTGHVCTRRNPHNNECLRLEDSFRVERVRSERVCLVPETYCAERGTSTSYERDTMKIKFKNLPALGDSESETFEVVARQRSFDGENVIYDVKPLETLREYKVTQKRVLFVFKTDDFLIEEK